MPSGTLVYFRTFLRAHIYYRDNIAWQGAPHRLASAPQQFFSPLLRSSSTGPLSSLERPVLCHAADSSPSETPVQADTSFQVELDTRDAQTSLRFGAVRVGSGKAVVIEAVAIGSAAEAAGVRPGQQILSLSDPIRSEESWRLNDRASLRYVKDTVRMRRAAFIRFDLSRSPLQQLQEISSSSEMTVTSSSSGNEEDPSAAVNSDLLSAIAAQSLSSSDGEDGSSSSAQTADSSGPGTIGERLERNYRTSNVGMTDLERRQARRKEYFEQTSERNDSPFFIGILAAFVLPAVIILAVATYSGYLDALAAGWSGR